MASVFGAFEFTQATVRPNVGTGGSNTPKPFPTNGTVRTPSLSVTAAAANAGTIYISSSSGVSTATGRERTMIKLSAGQTFTFTGIPIGGPGYRDMVFGSARSYIHVSATPNNLAICTYYKQS